MKDAKNVRQLISEGFFKNNNEEEVIYEHARTQEFFPKGGGGSEGYISLPGGGEPEAYIFGNFTV